MKNKKKTALIIAAVIIATVIVSAALIIHNKNSGSTPSPKMFPERNQVISKGKNEVSPMFLPGMGIGAVEERRNAADARPVAAGRDAGQPPEEVGEVEEVVESASHRDFSH